MIIEFFNTLMSNTSAHKNIKLIHVNSRHRLKIDKNNLYQNGRPIICYRSAAQKCLTPGGIHDVSRKF